MTITNHDGFAFLPKRCNTCNRLFWLEEYDIHYKEIPYIYYYDLKQIECMQCVKQKEYHDRILKE